MLANHQQGVGMPGGVVSSPGRGSNPNHNNSSIVGSSNRPPTNISNANVSSNRTAFPTNTLNKPVKCCDWCEVPGKSTKFVLKHSGTAKEFCSQECMNEYQNSLSPLCCQFCKKRLTGVLAVRSDNRGRSFCSVECLQKLRVKEVQLQKQQQQQHHLQNLNLTSSVRPQQHPQQERTLPSTIIKAQTPPQQNPLLSQQQKLQPPAHPQQQKPAVVVHPQPSKSSQQQKSAVPMSSSLSQIPSTPPSSVSNNLRKIPVSSLTGGTLPPPSPSKMKGTDNSSTTSSSSVSSLSEKGMAGSKLTPATRPKSKDKQRDILFSHFDWDEYLVDTNSTPAPKECFKQSHVPPSNDFDVGMKLEARDPRNTSVVTLATVIHLYGSRILLRLDGTDSSNDFYELVDSENIQHFGTCESNGELLQPPLGFTQNLNKWSVFQVKQLHNARLAPKECFKQEPLSPKSNKFEVGMKLEAVEKKYPYYVYPATIEDVNDDKIKISFDGYPESMSYWTDYRSRDLFWCGFTKESGGFLQHPGEISSKATNKSTKAKTPSTTTITTKEGKKETPARKAPVATPTQRVVNGTDSKHDKKSEVLEGKTELSAKKVNGNTGDNRGREQTPKTDAKVVKLPVQHTPTTSTSPEAKHFTLKIKPPQPPSSDRNHRAIVKQEQSRDGDTTGNKRKMEESQILSDSETPTTPLKKKPLPSSSSLAPSKPSTPAYRPSPTPETKAVSPTLSSSSTSTSSTVHLSPPRPPPTVASLNIPRDPNEWTTEQTFSYITSIDPTLDIDSLKKSFIENLIDGKSFLLLSSDMMMKYMNIKLGPALKIAKISESLNKAIGSRNQGR